jgi:hypothetical protein
VIVSCIKMESCDCVGWGKRGSGCLSFTLVYKLIKNKNRNMLNVFCAISSPLDGKEEWG